MRLGECNSNTKCKMHVSRDRMYGASVADACQACKTCTLYWSRAAEHHHVKLASECHSVDRSPILEAFALWQCICCSRARVDCDGHFSKHLLAAFGWVNAILQASRSDFLPQLVQERLEAAVESFPSCFV